MHFSHYTIRLLTEEDLHSYHSLIDRNRSRLEPYFPGTVAATQTLEDTDVHLKETLAKCVERSHYPFVVLDEENGKLVASIQIKNIDWNIPKAEAGYFIDAAYEGKGVISSAVSKVLAYGFNTLGLAKIFIRVHERNIGSRLVAEKNGMMHGGTIRNDYKMPDGTIVDLMYYGILREEFQVIGKR